MIICLKNNTTPKTMPWGTPEYIKALRKTYLQPSRVVSDLQEIINPKMPGDIVF